MSLCRIKLIFDEENLDKLSHEVVDISSIISQEEKKKENAGQIIADNKQDFDYCSGEISKLDDIIVCQIKKIACFTGKPVEDLGESKWDTFAFILGCAEAEYEKLQSYEIERFQLYLKHSRLKSLIQENQQIIDNASQQILELGKRKKN